MSNLDRREAGMLGHRNLMQYHRESPLWSAGGVVQEEDGLLCYANASSFPIMLNGAFRTDDKSDPDFLIGRATNFFTEKDRGFTLWIHEEMDEDLMQAAQRQGFAELIRQPEMVCTHRLPAQPLPDDVEISQVKTTDELAHFAEINASAFSVYGMPPQSVYKTFSKAEKMLVPHVVAVIAYVQGIPASAALTFVHDETAGLYWVGTIEAYRKRGLAKAVVREVTNAGFDLGARISTLQATVMGEPIYKKLGYETVFNHRIYVRSREKSS
jgi:GNAT superfamily N-acetyltransferase